MKKYAKRAVLGLVGVVLLLLVWGVLIEPRLIDEREEVALIPGLPTAWEAKQVALVADFQVGMWMNNTDTARRIVARLIERRPAAVLIAGDFVYKPTEEEEKDDVREEYDQEEYQEALAEINTAVGLVRPLTEAGIPVYAVLGNHDYAMMTPGDVKLEWLAEEISRRLEAAGVEVLDNEAAPLLFGGNIKRPQSGEETGPPLYVVGIGSHFARNDKPEVALSQVPAGAPRLALMHNPDSFAKFPANAAPLALAGHTHGGQIRVPFTPEWSWMALATKDQVHADGWIDGYGQPGNRLYVNRGIGFSYAPIRINCRPEVTLFTLRRKSPVGERR